MSKMRGVFAAGSAPQVEDAARRKTRAKICNQLFINIIVPQSKERPASEVKPFFHARVVDDSLIWTGLSPHRMGLRS